MQHPPQTGASSIAEGVLDPRHREDRMYQLMTVAAILVVLAPVWIF